MTSSASHDAYNTLISLHDKLTCLNGVIMPEAVNKLEDKLGGIFTVTKTLLNPPNEDFTIGGKKLLPAIYRP